MRSSIAQPVHRGTRRGTAVPTVYIRTFKRAAEIVGGEEALAFQLQVTPSELALWIQGKVSPPGDAFLRATELVTAHELLELTERTRAASGSVTPPEGPNR